MSKVWRYGDHVDTDVIIPARYLNTADHKELAAHCMEDIDAQFKHNVKPGDVMAAGWNFGCGSSREHAPIAIRESGVACVIAKSFARIFYRNAINLGLPVVECADADKIRQDDDLEIDFAAGRIRNHARGEEYFCSVLPPHILELIREGGLIAHLKHQLAAR